MTAEEAFVALLLARLVQSAGHTVAAVASTHMSTGEPSLTLRRTQLQQLVTARVQLCNQYKIEIPKFSRPYF